MSQNSVIPADTFTPDVSTLRNDAQHRYELHAGSALAVQLSYVDRPGHVDFIHTQTSDGFQGEGLARVLVHFALDDVVAAGKRIVPHCPYVAGYLKKHGGYEQYIDWPGA